MAKRKVKVVRRSVRKPVRINVKASRKPLSTKMNGFSIARLLLNLIFIALIIFGIYVIWTIDWLQGVGIIFLALVVYLFIKLIANIRKK
ncbi:hypothetical protein J4205_04205 [Candidatus Pacearchaeota archaeon]|nr:hypothetical protein [Candidatus Pacearchaeota archaeon]